MRLKQEQLVLLALVTVFFGLQVLPHQITLLHNSGISFFYLFVAMLLVPTILVCLAIALLGIALTRVPERMHWQNWFATFVFMLVAGIVLTICNVACARGLPVGSYVRPFNRQEWAHLASNQYVPGDMTTRQKMLGDVIHSVVRNKSKASIVALLGRSDGGEYFAESGRDLIYHMGPQRDSVFATDDEWLLIWFDSTDRVSRYEVRSD